ncbi:Rrf2 family transcriptional regulator [Thalassolituus sp.]|jgi:Rrf2 family nitric oxide-sensitive transcriptional repressor|uniref:Rrf2 family transcriptional regulator n=1 Tax=Thalassolituus sp. TaxID=2030822 RepID=UPI00263103C0|nr:Rrf2 family transcriptional regulator [uncultured Thalassolituus sp.]TNC93078.1 MAG: transcriptional repressor NsrR [Thalassolituus sp.]
MQLNSFTDYALRSLILLSVEGNDRIISAAEISETFGISRNHLMKVVNKLAQLGYVDTLRGKHGGLKLKMAPVDINIGALIRQTEPMQLLDCSEKACHITRACRLKGVLADAKAAFLAVLDKYTLEDVISDNEPLKLLLVSNG